MEFTGERVVPGRVEESLWAEHLARYSLAARFVRPGSRILDYACGTGYGSALLKAAGADWVVGVDRSVSAIEYAKRHYSADGVNFFATDCEAAALPSGWFDLVVSFEAIEHMVSPQRYVREIERVVKPEGLLILSTPNKKTYTDERQVEANPFHVKEFYRQELTELLREVFSEVLVYGQGVTEGIVFANISGGQIATDREVSSLLSTEAAKAGARDDVLDSFEYFVVFCSNSSLGEAKETSYPNFFYVSGTNEIRTKRNRVIELQEELEHRTRWAVDLDRIVAELRAELQGRKDGIQSSEQDPKEMEHRWSEQMERLRAESARAAREVQRLRAKNARAANEVQRLRDALETASQHQAAAMAEAESRVAFIQSGNPMHGRRCLEVLKNKIYPGAPVTYIGHSRRALLDLHLLPPGSEVLLTGPRVGQLLCTAAYLRHERFDCIALILSGETGFRRFKLLGLVFACRNLLIFNENGDCFFFSVPAMARHVRWRIGERLGALRTRGLLRATLRTLREEGPRGVIHKIRERWRTRHTYRPRSRLFRRFRWMRSHVFPKHKQPALSVVIPAHKHEWVTYECLVSILANAGSVRYEIIVVDDGSGPAMGKMLLRQRNVRVVIFDSNRGFVAACNAGARAARGSVIFFLNNDTLLCRGAFEALLNTFDTIPDCGVVGTKLIYPGGSLQEAGGIVWKDGQAWNFGKHDDPAKPQYNYVREVDYCSGAALAVRKLLFEQLNGFDPIFAPAYWEDTDLCFRARARGFGVIYQPAAAVVHLEGLTSGRRTDRGIKSYEKLNRRKFVERWYSELENQVEHNPSLTFLARDRNRGPVVLVFDHYVPTPDKDAGSYAMFSVLKSLRQSGHRVIFWPDNLYRTPRYAETLQQMGIEVIYGPIAFQNFVREVGPFVDVAIAYRAEIADKYLPQLPDRVKRRVYMCVDLEHVRERRRLAVEATKGRGSESDDELLKKLVSRETNIISNVDCVAVHSPVEREILACQFPGTKITVLPLPVRVSGTDGLKFGERKNLLFVGSSHPPNVDAVTFYRTELAELIAALLPDAELIVVGEVYKKLTRRELKCPGIRFTGFVPSVSPYYESARVLVAPLRYGAGIKGKILEAMSFGIPVVTTPIGAEGIPLEHGVSGFIAEDPEDFAEAVARVYRDRELWQSIRLRARKIIETEYSMEQFRRCVDELVASSASSAGAREVFHLRATTPSERQPRPGVGRVVDREH